MGEIRKITATVRRDGSRKFRAETVTAPFVIGLGETPGKAFAALGETVDRNLLDVALSGNALEQDHPAVDSLMAVIADIRRMVRSDAYADGLKDDVERRKRLIVSALEQVAREFAPDVEPPGFQVPIPPDTRFDAPSVVKVDDSDVPF